MEDEEKRMRADGLKLIQKGGWTIRKYEVACCCVLVDPKIQHGRLVSNLTLPYRWYKHHICPREKEYVFEDYDLTPTQVLSMMQEEGWVQVEAHLEDDETVLPWHNYSPEEEGYYQKVEREFREVEDRSDFCLVWVWVHPECNAALTKEVKS